VRAGRRRARSHRGLLPLREGGAIGVHRTAAARRRLNRYLPAEPALRMHVPAGPVPCPPWGAGDRAGGYVFHTGSAVRAAGINPAARYP
jgi:hypothetical protein